MKKIAVILFNLGGPDDLKSVGPFLFKLFNDPAIIHLPQPFRWIVARLITAKRLGKAKAIYQKIGGKSPILEQTMAQAEALEALLKKKNRSVEYKTFVSMRYTQPRSSVTVKKVKAYKPDHVLLLPLYPQFSTTTTGSSFKDWKKSVANIGLDVPTSSICCYPADFGFVAAHAKLIKEAYWKAAEAGKPRILFSAHGLPEKIIQGGDPYQWQVERTAGLITQVLAIDDLDWRISYQSKVGTFDWIGPPTDEEIVRAGNDKLPLVVVPIAFVSEHSETLVELDMDYRKLASQWGVPVYFRVQALSNEPLFIDALADLCINADLDGSISSFNKTRYCRRNFDKCPCMQEGGDDVG